MSSLIERMKKQSKLKHTAVLESSKMFDNVAIKHEVPAINIAFSGSVKDGGILPGITTFAGKSKHGKSILGLSVVQQIMKHYKDKGQDCPCLFYDSEFGTPKAYLSTFGIDTENVLHCPITNIEELKFDIVQQLESLADKDHLVIFIDSLGNLASKKEVEDSMNDKSAADMTRAKQLKSLFRMITPHMRIKKIHMVVIQHVYESIEIFSKTIVGGGTGTVYSSDSVFVLGRQQEKDGSDIVGFNIMMTIEKSRYCREKSVFPIELRYEGGMNKWSGLLDIAIDIGFVVKPSNGWFCRVIDGVVEEQKWRRKDTNSADFWNVLLDSNEFNAAVEKRYRVAVGKMYQDEASLEPEDESELVE